jgi:hypothetical protein
MPSVAGESGWLDVISWRLDNSRGVRLRYDDGTVFVVDESGSHIWAVWPSTLSLENTTVYLLGSVLAFVLQLRGITCLHASAISVDGKAVALAGPSGAGKSTTAAAFARRGFVAITDDLLALEEGHGGVVAHSGCPRLRLHPEAVHLLYGAPDALPPLAPNWHKRYLDLRSQGLRFERNALSLAAIYLLEERCEGARKPQIESLNASAAILGLLANSYQEFYLDRQSHARDFNFLGRVAGRVAVRRVVRRTGPDSLSDLCDAILDDFHSAPTPWSMTAG